MFVKQIIIQGFKSYKDQIIIEPFSRHHNVVVGRNGSGKSNFFAAIRFVLSDAYTHMSRDERQALLYEGSGSTAMSGYVEIVFDNSDNRIPSANKEVVIRRTIGLTKDDYSVDGKSATKNDVMSLLESAGFSRSNPYYIVPQGRIAALTNSKDEDRLQLLKEIAGAQIYEDRRKESLKLLNETNIKREKIDESLKFIDERLGELEDEIKELRVYQELDKEKRSLDFSILDRELQEVNDALDHIESTRSKEIDQTGNVLSDYNSLDERARESEKEISSLRQKIELLELDKASLQQDIQEKIKQKAQTELKLNDLVANSGNENYLRQAQFKEADQLNARITEVEAELLEITPEYEKVSLEESSSRHEVIELESLQQLLQLKQSQARRFKTKEERDFWLKSQIRRLEDELTNRRHLSEETAADMEQLSAQLSGIRQNLVSKRVELKSFTESHHKVFMELTQAELRRDKLIDERKQLWRNESKIDFALDGVKESIANAENAVSETITRDLSMGLSAVREIADKNNLSGVYGTVCDLIEADDMYNLAIEVTAGVSLFHVVVDTDETATKVMDVLSKENSGRSTFMPLNRLTPRQYKYPEDANDAIPLISKLKYDSKFAPAIQQVFGSALVCMNLDAGRQYAHTYKLNAITLQGDRVDTKGVLTGGFHDSRKSRIERSRQLKIANSEHSKVYEQKNKVQSEIKIKDQEINIALSHIQKLGQEKLRLAELISELSSEIIVSLSKEESQISTLYKYKELSLSEATTAEKTLESQLSSYFEDVEKPFDDALVTAYSEELESVTRRLPNLKSRLQELEDKKLDLQYQKDILDAELHESLYVQRDQLQSRGLNLETASADELVENTDKQIKQLLVDIENLQEKAGAVETSLESFRKKISKETESLEDIKRNQLESTDLIQQHQKQVERAMARRTLLIDRKTELNTKIRELGVLPEDAYFRFTDVRSRDILLRSQNVSEQLKKFGHVNKKAAEQYSSFARQREEFKERQGELEEAGVSMDQLIAVLDQRKDEALLRSFKQVAKGFSEIFRKLVPAGTGSLVMQRSSAGDENEISVRQSTGVSMKVSFNSKEDEQLRIEQLSGGQKSLCALALIFAIQQSDPAPFYLFDEIDANLDTQYRGNVANMIREISHENGAQFICTTFRPEMIHVADKFYGVLYQSKMSTVASITRDDALSFVTGVPQ